MFIMIHFFTHLSQMDFPISSNWKSLFSILWLLGGIFHFQILIEHSVSKQWIP